MALCEYGFKWIQNLLGQSKNDLLFQPFLFTSVSVNVTLTAFMFPMCHVK